SALRDQLVNQRITVTSAEAIYENARLTRENAELAVVEYTEGAFPIQHLEAEGNIRVAEAELALAEEELKVAKNSAAITGSVLHVKRAELAVFRARFALEKSQGRRKLLLDYNKGRK